MRTIRNIQAALLLSPISIFVGCHACWDQACCPTDARAIVCAPGEEAVRRAPCGPDCQFYGHKPTCWGTWPEGWDVYHADRCAPSCNPCEFGPVLELTPALSTPPSEWPSEPIPAETVPLPPTSSLLGPAPGTPSNPFRG